MRRRFGRELLDSEAADADRSRLKSLLKVHQGRSPGRLQPLVFGLRQQHEHRPPPPAPATPASRRIDRLVHRRAAGGGFARRLPQVREDAAAGAAAWPARCVRSRSRAVALVAVGVQVAAHRFGRTLRPRPAPTVVGIDDAGCRAAKSPRRCTSRCRLHRVVGQGGAGVVAHSRRPCRCANTPAGARPSPSRFCTPGCGRDAGPGPRPSPLRPTVTGTAAADCAPAVAIAHEGAQRAMVGVPVGGGDQHHLRASVQAVAVRPCAQRRSACRR